MDLRVRQAVAHAIDPKQVNSLLFYGQGVVSYTARHTYTTEALTAGVGPRSLPGSSSTTNEPRSHTITLPAP